MTKDSMRSLAFSHLRKSVCLAAVATLASLPLLTHAANQPIHRPASLANSQFHLQPLQPNAMVERFVQLDEASVAELNIKHVEQTGSFASSDEQKAQAAKVSAQQHNFRSYLESMGAKILSSQRVGANGLRISVPLSRVEEISNLPGVRSVGRVEIHKLSNIESVPWIGATKVWASLGIKGKGVKVGVIDTGIDYTHANFGGSGNPADYAANNKNIIEPGTFPTAKVVGGWDFAGATYDANVAGSVPVPDADPLDGDGHGSHVSGTIAGIGVPGSIGPGVAPDASLYALKVFGDGGGSTDLTSLAIEWAMDPNGDGDMSDHLDVINMSLGSAFGDPTEPSAISSNNAAALGIIVVAAAGNEGAVPYVLGSPAIGSAVISVAASTPGGRVYAKFTVTAPSSVAGVYASVEGAGNVQLKNLSAITGALIPATPSNGCAPLTNAAAVSGNIALIARGTCNFLVKYQQAQAAGATAIVVYNNAATDPIVMGGLDETVTIPGVMISSSAGSSLAGTANVTARLDVAPDPTQDDRLATFSSEGPGGPTSEFKPDLSAPGVSIVSTGMGTGTGSANFQGTSMAAPHVAGAAALLRQLHPTLNQGAIKALLQNSTVNANSSYDTKLTRQGVGVIRVDRAAALTSYASPGGVSFGRLNPVLPVWRTQHVSVTGLNNSVRNFTATHVANHTMPGVEVSCPAHTRVRGQHPTVADITMKFDPRVAAAAGIADDALVSQSEVDGWCVFSDGKDELRVGYIAVVDPASSVFVLPTIGLHKVTVRNLGPALGWAEGFTLAKLGSEPVTSTGASDGSEPPATPGNRIAAVGFRRADPAAYGANVLELGVALQKPFTHISTLTYDILIDTNGDGVADLELLAVDLSQLDSTQDPGTFVTAQLSATDGFIDWEVRSWDYNDRTAILPFTFTSDGGLLPEKFNYTMTVTSPDGSKTQQQGSVDMSKEIVPDVNSFGVGTKDKIDVAMKGPAGLSLWLFQNNSLGGQVGLSFTK